MTQKPILTIPDDAKDALAEGLPERAKKVMSPQAQMAIARVVHERIMFMAFGPRMKPTIRQRLLMWSSFRALRVGMQA